MKRSDGILLDSYDGDIEFRFHAVKAGAELVRWQRLDSGRWENVASAQLSPDALSRLRDALNDEARDCGGRAP